MKFKTTLEVTGMKFSKGTMENGTEFDSTKVYVKVDLDASKGSAMGTATAEYNLGKAEEYKKYEHLAGAFPFMADAEMEIVTNGKTQKTVILTMRPIESAKPGKPNAAA